MKNKILKISVLVIMLVVTMFALSGCTETNNVEVTETNNVEVTECEHDWVVTSRYSFFTNSYKTVSKCSKCGKVVE